jgi:hypothetical protein
MMKFVIFLFGEGKKKVITPFVKWFGLVIAGKGCYDYGKYENLINGVDVNAKDLTEVLFLTKIQNLLKWIQDGNFFTFLKSIINDLSYKLGLPLKIITYFMILLSICFIIYVAFKIYKYFFNNKNKTYTEEIVDSFSDEMYKYLDKKVKERVSQLDEKLLIVVEDLEQKNNIVKDLQSKLVTEIEKKDEIIKDLQNKSMRDVEKKDALIKGLQIKGKTLQTTASKKEKMIKDLKNKMKKLQTSPKSRSKQRNNKKNNIFLK